MAEQDYLARFRTGGTTPAPAEQAPPGQTDYLARFRNQATAGPQPNIPIEQNTLGEEFRAGLGAGIDTFQGSLFGVAALVGRELGIDWMEKAGLEGAAEQFAQAGQATSTAGGFTDIEGPGDFFRWSSNALGQAIPSLATAIASGGIGGAVAKRSVEGGVKRALARTVEKELKQKGFSTAEAIDGTRAFMNSGAGNQFIMNHMKNQAATIAKMKTRKEALGQAAGAAAGSVPQQTGGIEFELREAGIEDPGLTALLGGVVGGALEAAPAIRLLRNMFPGVKKEVSTQFVKDFAVATGTQFMLEGGTEAAQEVISLAALAYHDPSFDMFSPDSKKRIVEAFAAGALVGAVTGGGSRAAGEVGTRLRKMEKPVLPTFDFESFTDPKNRFPDDGIPVLEPDEGFADNTVFQEIKRRVDATIIPKVNGAMNAVAAKLQPVVDKMDEHLAGGVNPETATFSQLVAASNKKFWEEHREELNRLRQYKDEKIKWIYETMEQIQTEEGRAQFLERAIEDVKQATQAATDRLRRRAQEHEKKTTAEVDNMEIPDDIIAAVAAQNEAERQAGEEFTDDDTESPERVVNLAEPGDVTPPPARVFGKRQRTSQAQEAANRDILEPYDSQEQAELGRATLMASLPGSTEEDFNIVVAEDGTATIELMNNEFTGQLKLNNSIDRALKSATGSTKNNDRIIKIPEEVIAAARENPESNVGGWKVKSPNIDVVTLAHAGKDLDPNSTTLEEGYVNMAGELLRLGWMDNATFEAGRQKLDKFLNKDRKVEKTPASLADDRRRPNNFRVMPQAIEDMNSFVEQMRARGIKIPNKMFAVFENDNGTYTWGISDKTRARALQAQDPDAFRVMLRALGDQRFQTKLAQDTEAEFYGTSVTSAAGDVNLTPGGTRGTLNEDKGRVEGQRRLRPDNPGVTGQQRMQVVGEETIQEGDPNLAPAESGPQRDFASEPTQQGFSQRGDNIQRTVKALEDTDPQSDDRTTNPENLESEFEDRRQELARQSNRKQAEATGPRRKGRLGPQTDKDWKRLRDWGRSVKAAFVFNPKAKKSAIQIQEPIKSAVNFIRKELGLTNNILVVDDYGLKQLIASGRMSDPVLEQTLNDPKVHARNIRIKGNSIIYLSEELMNDPAAAVLATGHELGHHVYRVMWDNLTPQKQQELRVAYMDEAGLSAPVIPHDRMNDAEYIDGVYSKWEAGFNEWMADQLAAYMGDRIRAGTQFGGNRAAGVTTFFQNVAETLQKLWNYLRNPRFQLNETYRDFVEAIRQKNAYSPDANPLAEQNLRLWFKDLGAANYAWFGEDLTNNNIDNLENAIEDTVSDARKRLIRATRRNYPAVVRRGKAIANWISKAYSLALAPATSVMRNIAKDVPAAQKLVRIFNREGHGLAKQSSNYHQRLNLAKGQFLAQYKVIQDEIQLQLDARYGKEPKKVRARRVEREMKKLSQSLRSKEGNPQAEFTPLEQKVRALFDDMHDYAVKSGLPLNKITNYLPKSIDKAKWIRNEQKIIAYMTDKMRTANMPLAKAQQNARAFYNAMLDPSNSDTRAVYDATESPSFRALNERRMKDPFFNAFLEDNLDAIMSNYINSVTKRAEFNRFMGSRAAPFPKGYSVKQAVKEGLWDPKGKMHDILNEAKRQNATEEELTTMEKYIDANLGQLGRDDISTGARKFMAGVMAYQNMRVLLFTVFASLPDMVGPAIRAGDMSGAFKVVAKNIRTIAKDGNELAEMARAYGIISDAASDHIMTEYVDNHFMDPKMRKWNDKFFEYTGLNWYTNFTRKMALQVGIDFITNAAHDAEFAATSKERAKATRKLAELGLTVENVQAWNRKGQPSTVSVADMDSDVTKVAEGLQQFVDESIMRPNASQRPLLASDPRAMLVYHLKGYLYAVHDIVIKRIKYNIDASDSPTEYLAAITPAIAMMALTAIGLELRELVQYAFSNRKPPTDRMDGWEYTWELFQRSGLTGISQLAFDWEGADERGMSKIAGVGGPTLSQIGEILSKPHTQTIPRAIPVVSQLPAARDAVRTVL